MPKGFLLAGKTNKLLCDIVSETVLGRLKLLHPIALPERGNGGNQGSSRIEGGSFPKRIWSVLGFVLMGLH